MALVSSDSRVVPHDHVVNLYDDDAHVVADVLDFLAVDLADGGSAVVVATPEHREGLAAGLQERGIALDAAIESGRYLALDAAELLAAFTTDGALDRERFRSIVGGVVARASQDGRPVRAFGEMVALLWESGDVAGAIELEGLWNDLAQHHQFSLYCAYPMALLASEGDLAAIGHVCDHHSSVVTPRSYRPGAAPLTSAQSTTERSQLFLPVSLAVRAARRFAAHALREWGENALVDDITLVVSELATNAVIHASGPFRISLHRLDGSVRITVEDPSATLPRQLVQPIDVIGGRGIALVARVCSRWGTEPQSAGKVVWAEFDCSPA